MRSINIQSSVIALLWLSIASSLLLNTEFDYQIAFGTLAVLFATIFYFKNRLWSFSILALGLFFATFSLAAFNVPFHFALQFGSLKIHILYFFLLALLLFFERNRIFELREKLAPDESELAESQNNKISFFTRQFQKIPTEELLKKYNDAKMVEEARISIRQILEERGVSIL